MRRSGKASLGGARVLFDRPLRVHYGFVQLYPESMLHEVASDAVFEGQTNGLCGAAVEGVMHIWVGLHTGLIDVRVLLRDGRSPLDEREDIVEVSFASIESPLFFCGFDDGEEIDLPVGPYRARWTATGMDADNDSDPSFDGSTSPGAYELCFWPDADQRADEIIRVGSAGARYWHGERGAASCD